VEEFKKGSSKWIKSKGTEYEKFFWQAGYGAFSVSQSDRQRVTDYIRGQFQHHRTERFEDEFRKFLPKYEIDYDERYVWD
jgi:putative transposase